MDVEHHLTLDEQVVVEDQAVEGGVDRALDGVLDRHEPEVDLGRSDGLEHVGDGGQRLALGGGVVRPGVSSASSVNVPAGPKIGDTEVASRSVVTPGQDSETSWTNPPSTNCSTTWRPAPASPDDAVRRLRRLPFADLGFARVDHHRPLRQGLPEAVYGPGKTPVAVRGHRVRAPGRGQASPVLLTRADPAQVAATLAAAAAAGHPEATVTEAGTGSHATVALAAVSERPGRVVVVTAGTADLPVAEECTAVLERSGFRPALLADCGVAGVHRLLDWRQMTWPRPTSSSWWPAWKAHWPAWSAASCRRRWSPCRPAPATGRGSRE